MSSFDPMPPGWRLIAETVLTGVLTVALAYAVFFFIWVVL